MESGLDLLRQSAPFLLKGAVYTVLLSVIGMGIGVCLGFGLALMRLSRSPLLRWPASAYVSAFRGTPLLVQLFLIYYGLPQFGIEMPPLLAAGIGQLQSSRIGQPHGRFLAERCIDRHRVGSSA